MNEITKDGKYYTIETDLVLSRCEGIAAIADEYEYAEPGEEVIVRIKLKVPCKIFDPLNIEVTLPDNFLPDNPFMAKISELEIPLVTDQENLPPEPVKFVAKQAEDAEYQDRVKRSKELGKISPKKGFWGFLKGKT